MTFIEFPLRSGERVFVNAALVRAVIGRSDDTCTVATVDGLVRIAMPAHEVVRQLQAAEPPPDEAWVADWDGTLARLQWMSMEAADELALSRQDFARKLRAAVKAVNVLRAGLSDRPPTR